MGSGDDVEIRTAIAVAAGLPDAAAVVDLTTHPLYCNNAFVVMSGLKRRAFDERLKTIESVYDLITSDRRGDFDKTRACIISKKALRLDQLEVQNAAGERLTINLSIVPVIGGDGWVSAVIITLRDVSAESKMQERYKELVALERARAADLERQVNERTRELTAALEEVTRLSRTDPLTRLLNRRAFSDYAEAALELAKRHGRILAVLICDLDHFKRVNDTYGHDAGDTVLIAASEALKASIRRSDHLARFGGEEFVILLTEVEPKFIEEIARRCLDAVRSIPIPEHIAGATFRQTISIGVAAFPRHGESIKQLLVNADHALYQAKQQGRDRFITYSSELGTAAPSKPEATERVRIVLAGCTQHLPSDVLTMLRAAHAVTEVENGAQLVAASRREEPDAIVVDQAFDGGRGPEELAKTSAVRPAAVRILLTKGRDEFVTLVGSSFAEIDLFLLRDDAAQLPGAIEEALARREVQRGQAREPSRPVRVGEHTSELQRILEEDRIFLVFQPMLDARGRRVRAYEALCRVRSELFSGPAPLFAAALKSGELWNLSRAVRRKAAAAIATLPPECSIFLNLHPADIDDPELLVGEADLVGHAKRVVFEITERAAIPDFTRFADNVARLRDHGFRFAIDDLGAGYAGLNSVALLEPDFIKIDMELIRGLDSTNAKRKLVRHIVEFANDAQVEVIAEGVETEAEAKAATALGCHLLQGYFFAKPGTGFSR